MPRFAAFLRGVTPVNAKMSQLKAAFESAGFTDVRTVLGTGNVVFNAARAPMASIQRKAEAATQGRFLVIIRPIGELQDLLAADPYREFRMARHSKRVVTFLRGEPKSNPALPIELGGARILGLKGGEIFSAYVPGPKGPVFMTLIEKTFGKELTTRTWDTVAKVARS